MKTYMQSFEYANSTVSMLLGCEEELVEWGPPLGAPVNECAPFTVHSRDLWGFRVVTLRLFTLRP